MKTLGIITTYHSNDGMAIYAKILEEHLKEKFKIKLIEIKRDYLESPTRVMRKLRKKHFKALAEQTKDCDVLNVQFENWMFGVGYTEALDNFKRVVGKQKPLIVTFHYVGRPDIIDTRINVRTLYRYMRDASFNPLRAYARYRSETSRDDNFIRIVDFLAKRERNVYTCGIVHTKVDHFRLHELYGMKNVAMHPIRYLTEEQRNEGVEKGKELRVKLAEQLDAKNPDDVKIIGLFGFIDWSKGHAVAIRALRQLPKNYHIVIYGGLPKYAINDDHPDVIRPRNYATSGNDYLANIIEEAEGINKFDYTYMPTRKAMNNKFVAVEGVDYPRVHFMGSPLSTEDFMLAVASVDAVVVPYYETIVSASGNATWALEMRKPIFATRCTAFQEMNRLFPKRLHMFDIGNFSQLATLLKTKIDEVPHDDLDYTFKTNIETYEKAVEGFDFSKR